MKSHPTREHTAYIQNAPNLAVASLSVRKVMEMRRLETQLMPVEMPIHVSRWRDG
jgi:hypothetical protein